MTKKDFYQILGVDKNATQEQIEKRYQELINEYNPEKFKHETNCQIGDCGLERENTRQFCSHHCQNTYEELERKTEETKVPHETLSDPQKRKKYDEKLKQEKEKFNHSENSEPRNNNPKNPSGSGGGKFVLIGLLAVGGAIVWFVAR